MDEAVKGRIDHMVEDSVHKGYRDSVLPAHIVAALKSAHHIDANVPVFDRVRYMHLNPAKRSKINQKVVERYHKDLKNDGLLSSSELKKINIKRGEWSEDDDRRIAELSTKTSDMMVSLSQEGFDVGARWNQQIYEAYAEVRKALEANVNEAGSPLFATEAERDDALGVLDRWFSWNRERQDAHTALYAEAQGREAYSVDADMNFLLSHSPSVSYVEKVELIDDLRDKLRRFSECMTLRDELMALQLKQAKMLADSVEQRRDVCDEMARLYYCIEVIDEAGVGKGPIAKTFEQMWELPDDVIRYLQTQLYMFLRGEPESPEAIAFLETWGFLPAPPETGSKESSDESPAEQSSSTDSPAATATPADSSAPSPVTN